MRKGYTASVLFFFCLMVMMSSNYARASIYVDAFGSYLMADDAGNQLGGGGGIGINVFRDVYVQYRGMFTVTSITSGSIFAVRKEFNLMTHLVGPEYVLVINRIRLGWRNSLLIGLARCHFDRTDRKLNFTAIAAIPLPPAAQLWAYQRVSAINEMGLSLAWWTGLHFMATQWLAPFIDLGLHKSFFFNELDKKNIWGFQVLIGFRFVIGRSKIMEEDY